MIVVLAVLLFAGVAFAEDVPYRDPKQVRLFRAVHACPSTGKYEGACPGWLVDHAYPLCAGGTDTPANMHWQGRADSYIKDRLERELCALKKQCGAPAPADAQPGKR